MPIGSGIVYNTGDLILSQVSSSGTAFLETKIAAATSSLIYFDSTARINSASLNSITVGTASYVSGSRSIITNLTASNISASGTGSFGIVGIGTVNPAYKLDVNGNANFTNGFYTNTDASSTSYFVGANGTRPIIFQNNTATSYDFGFKFSDSNTFTLVGGNTLANPTTDLVSFTYDGNLGIGTTSPLTKLQVKNGSITAGTADSTNGTTILLGQYSSGNLTVLGSEYSSGGPFLGYGVSPSTASAASFFSSTPINIVRSAYIQDGGTHRWYLGPTQSGSIGTVANLSEVMRIASDGSVGIGTTNPTSKLHIVTTGTNDGIILDGSTNPIFIHRTSGSDRTYLATITNAGSFFTDANAYDFVIRSQTSNILLGRGSGASTMAIVGSNVGIGTSSPAQKLEVQSGSVLLRGDGSALFGTYYASAGENTFFTLHSGSGNTFHIGNDVAGTNYNTIVLTAATDSTGGKVGIGTNSPVAKLQVNGNISGSSFTSSVSNAVGFLGTSSWAQNVVTASYLVPTNSYTITNLTASNISASGTISASKLYVIGTANVIELVQSAVGSATYYVMDNTVETGGRRYRFGYSGGSSDKGSFTIYNQTDNVTPFTITTNGSVGIGTTNPVTQLHVSGSLQIGNGSNFGNKFTLYDDFSGGKLAYVMRDLNGDDIFGLYCNSTTGEARLLADDDNGIAFMTFQMNSSERMRITNGGNVGIGTTVPSGSLTVQSNANQLRLQTSSGPGAYFTEISSRYDSTHPFQLGVANNSSTATEFFGIYADSGGSNNRSVFPTGNVGIGTTSPNSKLEVAGGSGTAIISINNTTAGRSGSFGIDSNGVYIQNSNNGDYFDLKNASGTARFRVIYDNATHLTTNFVSIGNLSATGSKLSVFGNLSVGSTYGSTAAPSNGAIFQGSVGIGTTSPDSNLHVYSTSFEPAIRLTSTSGSTKTYGLVNNPGWATGSFHIYDFTTDNSRIHISSTGNIGLAVGSTTPANRLDVVGDLRVRAAGAAMILDTATTSDGRMEYKYNGTRKALIGVDSDNLQIAADSGNFLQFRTNNTQRMIINNSGGVGIGTSSPLYLVDIYDTGANSAMMSLRSSGSGNARIYFDAANGDLVGSDYCYLGQDDSTLNFVINTSNAAGNIHLQPKDGTNNGILYVSGSTRFGRVISQTHEFTGSINLSGSLNATASWANNVVSASYATTAQTANALNTGNSYTVSGLTNNGTLSQQGTLSMGSGYQILATTGTTSNPGIAFVGDTNTGIYSSGADTIGLVTGGSEKVTINSTGNVGIGTTNPGVKLDVVGGINSTLANNFYITSGPYNAVFYNYSTSSTDYNAIRIYQGASGSAVGYFGTGGSATGNVSFRNTFVVGTQNSNDFVLNTTDTERVRITSGGNVGIGTTTPNAKLDVNGNIIVTGSLTTTSTIVARNYIMATDTLYIQKGVGGYQSYITAEQTAASTGNSFKFWNSGTGTLMTIGYNGYVGIGTTSPTYQLHVNGGPTEVGGQVVAAFEKQSSTDGKIATFVNTTGSGYTSYIYIGSNPGRDWKIGKNVLNSGTTGHFQITNDLNQLRMQISAADDSITFPSSSVGIGTTNATDKLTVYGAMASYKTGADTVQTQVYLANGGNTRAFNLQLNSGGTGLDLWSYNSANAWLKHTTFDYDGRVGIGTAAPAAKLEISGSSNSALLHVKSPISGAILYVSGSGAVGINTSTVGAYTLQVNGSFAATTKSFVIDHPTKEGKKLIYGSLESPYHGIRLTGRDTLKDGKCKIQLPDYIYKLILHDSVNIQLTGIKCNKTLYVDDINIPENYFTIAYDKALFESYKDYDFFWDFTAIRADVPELNTEL